MAKFRMVHTEFWNDPMVVEEMTPEDKYFFLYLLTNTNTTQIGIYQITKKQMAFDMGYSMETINSLLDRFINHHKLVQYNPETREIAIKNWGKYNLNRGGKPVVDCVISELKEVKDKTLIQYVGNNIKNGNIKRLFDTYHDTLTIRGQEEKEKEKEEEKEIPYVEIVNYLNRVADKNYRHTTRKTRDLIKARWNEGFRLEDFKKVIDIKTAEWKDNEEMNKYLRPQTLFSPKFEGYLNQDSRPLTKTQFDDLF